MRSKKNFIQPIFFLFFIPFFFLGCEQPKTIKPLPLTEAHQKFLQLCKDEYKLENIKLIPFQNTVWIYLPLDKSFMELKANPDGPRTSDVPKETRQINFLDGKFEDSVFKITYDIALGRSYSKEYGYGNTFSQEYQNKQRDILTAIQRVYTGTETSAQQQPAQDKVPDFFVMVAADITNGIETQIILNFQDLKRVLTDAYFQEEYVKRAIMDYPTGNKDIIGDEDGKHLHVYDMTWGEFLSKQIVHRIRTKYERSAFPPVDEDKIEILRAVKEAVNAYNFTDYTAVQLKDLNHGTLTKINQKGLEETVNVDVPEPEKGRLIQINFNPVKE